MSERDCPLCGAGAGQVFKGQINGYDLIDCPSCGAGYCRPFKNPGPEYYEHKTDIYAVTCEETTDPMSFEYDEALAALRAEARGGACLLDVGCGAGGFLHRAKAAGFTVSGVDFNPARVAALRGRGFEVFLGGLPEFAQGAAPASFDAVTMFEIIEHLDDPADWLKSVLGLLKPGGLFIVGTPNRARTFDPFQGPGMEEIDHPPHHLTRWNAAALTGLLSRAGFASVECRPLGYPLPLLRLMLRNSLRFGLATKALNVEQVRHAPVTQTADRPTGRSLVKALVATKESVLNVSAGLGYPFFSAAYRAFGWQGAILLATARKPA